MGAAGVPGAGGPALPHISQVMAVVVLRYVHTVQDQPAVSAWDGKAVCKVVQHILL